MHEIVAIILSKYVLWYNYYVMLHKSETVVDRFISFLRSSLATKTVGEVVVKYQNKILCKVSVYKRLDRKNTTTSTAKPLFWYTVEPRYLEAMKCSLLYKVATYFGTAIIVYSR